MKRGAHQKSRCRRYAHIAGSSDAALTRPTIRRGTSAFHRLRPLRLEHLVELVADEDGDSVEEEACVRDALVHATLPLGPAEVLDFGEEQ